MKITDIKAEKVRIELTSPFRVAFAEINYSENLLIKVSTDEGIDGYGEAAPLPFVTGETIDSVVSVISLLRPGLIGMNPLDIEKIHELMDLSLIHILASFYLFHIPDFSCYGTETGGTEGKLLRLSEGKAFYFLPEIFFRHHFPVSRLFFFRPPVKIQTQNCTQYAAFIQI